MKYAATCSLNLALISPSAVCILGGLVCETAVGRTYSILHGININIYVHPLSLSMHI